MKTVKVTLIILAALLALGVSTTSYAFHGGGVAECGGCHSMHGPKAGGSKLLIGIDQSSTCLSCHEKSTDTGPSSYHVSSTDTNLIPLQRGPGGDFGWLRKSYGSGEPGRLHGHNIIAADFTYSGDVSNTDSPGGSFPGDQLGCHSCHDPHGKYRRLPDGSIATSGAPTIASGSYKTTSAGDPPPAGTALGAYRLLAGSGYSTIGTGVIGFPGVPAAKAPNTYNQTEATTEKRVAYGVKTGSGHTTWSNWCGTCHGAMHSTGNYVHKVDTGLGSVIASNYKKYVKSGDTTGGSVNGFTSLVPFAKNTGDYAALATSADNTLGYGLGAGPADDDQVMCLTCHRAHASGFVNMLRWNMEGTNITDTAGAYASSASKSAAVNQAGYYDRPSTVFAKYQRVLCNKCHIKD